MDSIIKEILCWDLGKFRNGNKPYFCNKIPKNFDSSLNFRKSFETSFFNELKSKVERLVDQKFISFRLSKGMILSKNLLSLNSLISITVPYFEFQKFQKGKFIFVSSFKEITRHPKNYIILGIIKKMYNDSQEILLEIGHNKSQKFCQYGKEINIFHLENSVNIFDFIEEYKILKFFSEIPSKIQKTILSIIPVSLDFNYTGNFLKTRQHLVNHFNNSQIMGIFEIFNNIITLIQGPPGTGKTRTILGIISVLLKIDEIRYMKKKIHRNFLKLKLPMKYKKIPTVGDEFYHEQNFFLKKNYFFCTKKKILDDRYFDKKILNKKKIVICASSNAAIDENLARILTGLPIKNLKNFYKRNKIVRLGPNYKVGLDHLSLENYSITWLSENDTKLRFNGIKPMMQKARIITIKKSLLLYTTISCTGYSIMKKLQNDERVVIDEAAQAIELSTLVPIKKTCKQIVLIGDIQQLPATVFSKCSILSEYDRSLFKRLQMKKYPVSFLETQYRMHPQISSFPARKFYRNGLKDSQLLANSKIFHALRCFGPLIFYAMCEGHEQSHSGHSFSWCNLDEARIISLISRTLVCLYPILNKCSVGIITGYNGQIKEIENFGFMKKKLFNEQINTVDGFQGKEKDFIFFSCVRSKLERGIGFLSDCRRINVAFTRARASSWCIGNINTLKRDKTWREIILDLIKRKRLFNLRKPLERSGRKLIYWSEKDEENFFFDGDICSSISKNLLTYFKKYTRNKKITAK